MGKLPEWITSQLRARGQCERGCGRQAVANVTWADGLHSGTEMLCGPCWAAGEAEAHAATSARESR
jgi:hypothetical protein